MNYCDYYECSIKINNVHVHVLSGAGKSTFYSWAPCIVHYTVK